jgi:hypothetical protein
MSIMLQNTRVRRLTIPLAGILLLGLALPWSQATEPEGSNAMPSPEQIRQMMQGGGGGGGEGDNDGRFKKLEDVTKDMESIPGLFTLYRYSRSDDSKDPEKLLALIPGSMLGQDLLFATSLSSGGRLTGFMWSDYLIRWEVVGDYVKMVTPDLRYIQKSGAPTTDAVNRTYPPRYIAATRILSKTPRGDVLIDLEPLLKSNIADIQFLGGNVVPPLSTWSKVKNFPENILIEANLALSTGQGGTTAGVAYAFRKLPNEGSYQPRMADPRVGYFLTARSDFAKAPNERTTMERYINRWKLEKRDASLTLSPPKTPITFIIEDTVPIRWRRWVREGIEEWNKAFEKIGIDRAIVVHQQTRDNEWADIDPEDARYNFIRWIVSGRPFAMGPSRTDPRTGQILDADILFDDSFARAWLRDFDLFAPSKAAELFGQGFYSYLQDNRDLVPPSLLAEMDAEQVTDEDRVWNQAMQQMHQQGRCLCSYAHGMQQELALGHTAMLSTGASGKEIPEHFMGEAIRLIVTHEVGHTLGLRHNFKGSSWLSLDEIKRRRNETDLPITASVMDYNPLLFFAGDDLEKVRHYVTPTIGPYDEWAIEYGYSALEGKQDEALAKIASRGSERPLRYGTDQDSAWIYSADPFIRTYDLSTDPVAFAESRTKLADELMKDITDWAYEEGEAKNYLTSAFNTVFGERTGNYRYVAGLIGGQHYSRAHKGDPNAPAAFTLIEPELQRKALKVLGETIFNDTFYQFDPELLNNLADSRWWDWSQQASSRLDYPIHDRIRRTQMFTLLSLAAPPVLQRIYDAELKSNSDDKFTVAELINTTVDMIWNLDAAGGSYTDSKPMISSIKRSTQRDLLTIMLLSAQAAPGSTMSADIQSMIREALRELNGKIDSVLAKSKPDFASRAHLRESKSRIERVLDAQFIAN